MHVCTPGTSAVPGCPGSSGGFGILLSPCKRDTGSSLCACGLVGEIVRADINFLFYARVDAQEEEAGDDDPELSEATAASVRGKYERLRQVSTSWLRFSEHAVECP